MSRARSLIAGLSASLLLLACNGGSDTGTVTVIDGAGPMVRAVDSVLIRVPDWMLPKGGAEPWSRARDGRLIVGEAGQLMIFASDGQSMRTFGARGGGPGEITRMSGIGFLPGDSLVAVVDAGRARIIVYDLNTGRLQREVALGKSVVAGQQWRVIDGSILVPVLMDSPPFVLWNLTTDAAERWGAEPPVYRDASMLYQAHGEVSAAPTDSGWVVLYPADPVLRLLGRDGSRQGAVALPTRRRLGVPENAAQRLREGVRKSPPEFRFVASISHAIHRLPSGEFAVVHFDTDAIADPQTLMFDYTNVKFWVSLLSADLTEACVDGLVPVTVSDYHRPQLQGDTLFILTRTITETDDVQTWLRSFVISTEGCDWMPTGGVIRDP